MTTLPDGTTTEDETSGGSDEADVKRQLNAARRGEREAKKRVEALEKNVEELTKEIAGYQDRDKTDAQRNADALEALKAEVRAAKQREDAAKVTVMRHEIAASKGLSDWVEDLHGDTREDLEAAADRILARIGEQGAPRKPAPVSALGRGDSGAPSTADQFAAAVAEGLR